MKRLERILDKLEDLLEGGGPVLISVCYEGADGTTLYPTPEEKARAIREALERGRDFAVAWAREA